MLYFIKTLDYYKIGFTENLDSRMKDYAIHNPIAELLGIKEGTSIDERRYQMSFCEYEGTGEWYKLPKELVNELLKDFTPSNALVHHPKKYRSKSDKSKSDRREYYKKRAKRPERIAYMKEYLKEYSKQYRQNLTEEQKEKQKQYQKEYRERNKEKLKKQQKEWREKNKATPTK